MHAKDSTVSSLGVLIRWIDWVVDSNSSGGETRTHKAAVTTSTIREMSTEEIYDMVRDMLPRLEQEIREEIGE